MGKAGQGGVRNVRSNFSSGAAGVGEIWTHPQKQSVTHLATNQIRMNCQNFHKVSKPGYDTTTVKTVTPFKGDSDSDTPSDAGKLSEGSDTSKPMNAHTYTHTFSNGIVATALLSHEPPDYRVEW